MGQYQPKDIAGQRHGMITAIRRTDKRASDHSYIWEYHCDCGNTFERNSSAIKRVYSCGCTKRTNAGRFYVTDLSGMIVNNIMALSPTNKRKHTYTVWIVKCIDCGSILEKAAYTLTKGTARHRCSEHYRKHPPIERTAIPNSGAHVNAIFSHYITSAKSRNIPFELTKEQARHLFEQPCCYCGVLPSVSYTHSNLLGEYAWNGIDRIDSSKGYTLENCVPCCTHCNFSKAARDVNEFKDWIKRAYHHLFSLPNSG